MARRLPARIVDLVNRPWDKAVVHLQDIINAILDWLNDSWGGLQTTQKEIQTFITNNPDSPFDLEGATGDNLVKTANGVLTIAMPLTSSDVVDGSTELGRQFLRIRGTLPDSSTTGGFIRGVEVDIEGKGSGAASETAFLCSIDKDGDGTGYTGSSYTVAGWFQNGAYGTSTSLFAAGNEGVYASSYGTTVGTNSALFGEATGGNLNVSVVGRSSFAKASATNIGGVLVAANQGASGVRVGTYTGISSSWGGNPTIPSSAGLIVNNGDLTDPIAIFQNNGVAQVKIGDGVPNDNSQHFLEVVGTLPSSPSTSVIGVQETITSAGSASQLQVAHQIVLASGYSGSSITQALYAENGAQSTGTASFPTAGGNYGVSALAYNTTTGSNVGVFGAAQDGNFNVGLWGNVYDAKNNTTSIGVIGRGRNDNTTGTINIGGFFSLGSANPTYTSAALVADNADKTNPIARFRNNGTDQVLIGDGVPADNSQHFLEVVGTFPASPSTYVEGIRTTLTTAGSASQEVYGQAHYLNAGYTGSSPTNGGVFFNEVAGTASGFLSLNGNSNRAVAGYSFATTAGANTGVVGQAEKGDKNAGVLGIALTAKNSATNIGVAGIASNTGTSPVEIGGYFGLNTSNPTFTSAALVADNAATTNPIARFRNNGTDQVLIGDGVPNDNSQHFLEVVGTLPSSPSADVIGVQNTVTGAGSASFAQYTQYNSLLAGYTGSSSTFGLSVENFSAGTGNHLINATGNMGAYFASYGTTTGLSVGSYNYGGGGDLCIGTFGGAIDDKNNATNAGGVFVARNTGTSSKHIGIYAGLQTTNPTFESAAAVLDNGGTTSPILRARDNGTDVWTVQDGGHVYAKMSTKTLTESTDTAFVRIAVAQGTSVSGCVKYDIQANDGTDYQSRSGVLQFNCVNKAGTETPGLSTPSTATEAFSESAGGSTLTNTFTTATGTDTFDIRANAVSSLTQTTLRINYTVEMWSNAVTTVTPQ